MSHQHFILHKPYGYLSQFIYELKRKETVANCMHSGTMAIGRWTKIQKDYFCSPRMVMSEIIRSKKSRKKYYVQVDGIINQEAIDKMKGGVEIGFNGTKYRTKSEASLIIDPALGPEEKKYGRTAWTYFLGVDNGKRR
jgi:23S rRNA pseudouridine2457 synthase